MTEWKQYRRKGLSEMMPYYEGLDMTGISIADVDIDNGSPKPGDMIARNPMNHADKWLVAEKYFQENLKPVDGFEITATRAQKFVRHIAGHLNAGQVVICKICSKSIDEICKGE